MSNNLLKYAQKEMDKYEKNFYKRKKKYINSIKKGVTKEIKRNAKLGRDYCEYTLPYSVYLFLSSEKIYDEESKSLIFKELKELFEKQGFSYKYHSIPDIPDYISICWNRNEKERIK